jgi:hypothetical protein
MVCIERIVLLDYIHRLASQKIEEIKIYTKYHNTRVHKIHTKVNQHQMAWKTNQMVTWSLGRPVPVLRKEFRPFH